MRPAEFQCLITGALVLGLVGACAPIDELGAVVPPTAAEDSHLPRAEVAFAGQRRWLHVASFGDSAKPPVFVLPGGPGGDYRLLLPLQALADTRFVVFWDQHGGGLSERISDPADLSIDSYDAEIAAVQSALAPGKKVILIGHSFGGSIATRYAARHPDAVAQLVLIEPGPLTQYAREHRSSGGLGSLADLERLFWDDEVLGPADHAQIDYRALGLLRSSSQSYYCSGQSAKEYPVWRFGAYMLLQVTGQENGFDYRTDIERYTAPTLVLAGTCGDLGADYQRAYNFPSLPGAELTTVQGANHITLFLEHADEAVAAIRSFLDRTP